LLTLFQFLELYGGLSAIVIALNVAAYKLYFLNQKVKLETAKDEEITKLKADLNASNLKLEKSLAKIAHVDQSRFDIEFEIYQKVWESLTKLNMEAEQLQYKLKSNDSIEEKDKDILKLFHSIMATSETIHIRTPFYPKSIHKITTLILSQLQDYITNVSKIREDESEKLLSWASDHSRVYAKSSYNELELAIKERLDSLSGVKNV
jgi:hypothetical protein